MKTLKTILVLLWRNNKALYKRVIRAIAHRNADEVIDALILYFENIGWLFCVITTFVLIIAGFFKVHCFIMAGFYFVLSGVIMANIQDRRKGKAATKNEVAQ